MPELTDFYHHEISKAMEYFIMAHQWVAKESEVNTDLIIETFMDINEKRRLPPLCQKPPVFLPHTASKTFTGGSEPLPMRTVYAV